MYANTFVTVCHDSFTGMPWLIPIMQIISVSAIHEWCYRYEWACHFMNELRHTYEWLMTIGSYWYLDISHIRHIDISIYVIYVILISRYTSYTSYWYLDIRTSHIWMTHDYRIILISRYTSYTSYWYLGHESLISRYEYDVSRYQYDVLISRYTSYWYLDIRTNKSCHAYT